MNNNINSQIKLNKVRMIIGITTIVFAWAALVWKELYTQKLAFGVIIAYTLITILLYVVKPYKTNQSLKKKLNE